MQGSKYNDYNGKEKNEDERAVKGNEEVIRSDKGLRNRTIVDL